jgi:hypothetical protein
MLGHKAKVLKMHTAVCLEDLVPPDNFYRELEVKLDLTFVRGLVRDRYSSCMGRPSIDPQNSAACASSPGFRCCFSVCG